MTGFILKVEELKLKNLKHQLGPMPIDDCIMLAQQADDFVKAMDVFDPARLKFQRDSRMWWQYAWLQACEDDRVIIGKPYVVYRSFLVGYPKKQPYLDDSIFRDWLRAKEETEITQEFGVYMPVYLRPDEVDGYARAMYIKQCGIEGRFVNMELLETETEN
jgi:hypothetical protein